LERAFEEADVLLVDRELGISNEVRARSRPRGVGEWGSSGIEEVSVQFGGLLAVDDASISVPKGVLPV